MDFRIKGMTVSLPRLSEALKRKTTKRKTTHNEREKDEGLYVIKINNNFVSKVDVWYEGIAYANEYKSHMIYLGHEVKAQHLRDAHIFDSLERAEFIHKESGGFIYKLKLAEVNSD